MKVELKAGQRIVFIGDSITDAGRDYGDAYHLGEGYAHIAGSLLMGRYAELQLEVYNRGINGHKLKDLAARWQRDCLALQPDILSIMIGINDIWHHRSAGQPIDAAYLDEFKKTYCRILTEARAANPELQVVLLQPFLLPIPEDHLEWEQELQPMSALIEDLAQEFSASYIRLHDEFKELVKQVPAKHFTIEDGVHPTRIGQGVIADCWLRLVEPAVND